jgi:hypothetical protein
MAEVDPVVGGSVTAVLVVCSPAPSGETSSASQPAARWLRRFFPLVVDQREGGCIAGFRVQTARRMRFNVARKLLSASNEDALRWFDCGARTQRASLEKIFLRNREFKNASSSPAVRSPHPEAP